MRKKLIKVKIRIMIITFQQLTYHLKIQNLKNKINLKPLMFFKIKSNKVKVKN